MPEVYLDHYAATPVLPEVVEAMLPLLSADFGNPSSLHGWGDGARSARGGPRQGGSADRRQAPEEIIFTSGGTEANNMAIKGIAGASKRKGNHVVVSAIEHFSVLHAGAHSREVRLRGHRGRGRRIRDWSTRRRSGRPFEATRCWSR